MNKRVGEVVDLFISQSGMPKRLSQTTINLDEKGLIGDKFYDKDIDRSVLITSTGSYSLAKLNAISLEYGELGENILIDFNPYTLEPATRLHIGNVILEISQLCTICNHLSVIDKKLPKLLRKDRGIFAKVIQSGTITLWDKIFLISVQ